MAQVLMYSARLCPYCRMAERLLAKRGIEVETVLVDDDSDQREEMTRRTGRTTVPQIFVGQQHVGGYVELAALDRDGKLDALLARV